MGAIAASRAVVVIIGAALVFAGVLFAGYAVMLALSPALGMAGAAGAAAAILLVVPLGYLAVASFRRPPSAEARVAAIETAAPEVAVLTVLAGLARERPLLAVLGAGILGAAEVYLKGRR